MDKKSHTKTNGNDKENEEEKKRSIKQFKKYLYNIEYFLYAKITNR